MPTPRASAADAYARWEGEVEFRLFTDLPDPTLSVPEQIAAKVGDRVIVGRLAPGSRIGEQELADEFKVSRGPVREAIRLLEREGLVTVLPRRGALVTQLSSDELRELYEVRSSLIERARRLCRSTSSGPRPRDVVSRPSRTTTRPLTHGVRRRAAGCAAAAARPPGRAPRRRQSPGCAGRTAPGRPPCPAARWPMSARVAAQHRAPPRVATASMSRAVISRGPWSQPNGSSAGPRAPAASPAGLAQQVGAVVAGAAVHAQAHRHAGVEHAPHRRDARGQAHVAAGAVRHAGAACAAKAAMPAGRA
jgi:DNA-binding transcriptional regulator YhcF (GntR family)